MGAKLGRREGGGTEKLREVGGGLNRVAMGHQGTAEKAGFLR